MTAWFNSVGVLYFGDRSNADDSEATTQQLDVWRFSQVKDTKLAEITRARDAACVANVTAHGRTWQADKRSQDLLGQAITLAQAGLPLPPVWRDYDNNDMPVNSVADLLAIAGAMAQATQAAYAKSWQLKAQVEAAQTVEAVNAVVW